MAMPLGMQRAVQDRKDRFGDEFQGFARSAGVELSKADIRNLERSNGKGCALGVSKLQDYLHLLGFELVVRRATGSAR